MRFVVDDGRLGGPRSARRRAIWLEAGASGWRSAAPSSTSRASSFSTNRREASIRVSRRQFWRLIEDMSRDGVTILVTTHYLDEAEHCHRIAIVNAGKLAAMGTSRELKQVFASRPIVEIHSARPVDVMRALDAMPEVEKTTVFGTAVHAVLKPRRHRPSRA